MTSRLHQLALDRAYADGAVCGLLAARKALAGTPPASAAQKLDRLVLAAQHASRRATAAWKEAGGSDV